MSPNQDGPVGNILPGRKVAEEFILYWSDAAQNPNNPEYQLAKKMNAPRKIVFSKTLKKSPWPNTKIVDGNLVDNINKIKKQEGNHMAEPDLFQA